jgi:tetratricopeptide (TPR) repeat protein
MAEDLARYLRAGSAIWKQWKRGKRRFAELLKRGVGTQLAAQTVGRPRPLAVGKHSPALASGRAAQSLPCGAQTSTLPRMPIARLTELSYTDPYVRWFDRDSGQPPTYVRSLELFAPASNLCFSSSVQFPSSNHYFSRSPSYLVLSSSVFIAFHRCSCDPRSTRSGSSPLASLSQLRSSFFHKEPFAFQPSIPPTFLSANSFRIDTRTKTGEGGLATTVILSIVLLLCGLLPTRSPARTRLPTQSSDQSERPLADAKSLFEQGKFTEADRAVREYLNSHPNSAEGHFLLGHTLFREMQAQAAMETQFPPQTHGPMASARTMSAASSEASVPKGTREMAKASLAEFNAGAKFHDPSAADLKIVALDYVLLADYLDADKWLTKMLEWAPSDSEGWYYLGRTKYNENRFAEALDAFQRCLKLDPQNVKAEDNLGLALAGLGRNEEATAAYQQAISWQAQSLTKNPGPYIDFGSLLIDENHPKDAVTFLLRAIEIAPSESRAHELLGKAYTRVEDFPRAQTELEKAIELSPHAPNLHCMLAPVYRKQGLVENAKTEYERCAALTGTHSSPEPR